jgi:hypothetical protein
MIATYLSTFLFIKNSDTDNIDFYSSIPNIIILVLSNSIHFIPITSKNYFVIKYTSLGLNIPLIFWNISYPFYLNYYKMKDLSIPILILYIIGLELASILHILNLKFLIQIKYFLI